MKKKRRRRLSFAARRNEKRRETDFSASLFELGWGQSVDFPVENQRFDHATRQPVFMVARKAWACAHARNSKSTAIDRSSFLLDFLDKGGRGLGVGVIDDEHPILEPRHYLGYVFALGSEDDDDPTRLQ